MELCSHVVRNPEECHACAIYIAKCAQDEIVELEGELLKVRADLEEARSKAVIQITEYQEKILRIGNENDGLRGNVRALTARLEAG